MQREKTYEGQVCGSGKSLKKAIQSMHNSAVIAVSASNEWNYDSINLQVTVDRIETSQSLQRYSTPSEPEITVYGRYKAVTTEYL